MSKQETNPEIKALIRIFLIAIAAAGVVFAAAAIAKETVFAEPQLEVFNHKTHEVYFSIPASDGTLVTLEWVHSIELEPITVTYKVEDGKLFLIERTVKSYGAGVESDLGGVTTVEDGVIYTRGLHIEYPYLNYTHSHDVHHKLTIGDHVINTNDIEHHAIVTIAVR